jgi:hypothetical protein
MLTTVAVMLMASLLMPAIVMFFHTFMLIFAEGRHHVYTADHRG